MKKLIAGVAAGLFLLAGVAWAGECCDKAKAEGHVCFKCHPDQAKTCCEKAMAKGKECTHPCCAEARKDGKVPCPKCNPKKEEPAADKKAA